MKAGLPIRLPVAGRSAHGARARSAARPVALLITLSTSVLMGVLAAVLPAPAAQAQIPSAVTAQDSADPSPLVVSVTSRTGSEVRLAVRPVPRVADPERVQVAVQVDGRPVPSSILDSGRPLAPAGASSVVMVLDVSGSMNGKRLQAAKVAARAFIAQLPGEVPVAVVAVSSAPEQVLASTTDRSALDAAIEGLRSGGDTALLDGIALGLASANSGTRLLVLSDGRDTTSSASMADVREEALRLSTPIDIVAISPDAEHRSELEALVAGTSGHVVAVQSASGLAGAFAAASADFAAPIEISATIPQARAARTLRVVVDVGDYHAEGAARLAPLVTAAPAAVPPVTLPREWAWLPWLIGALAGGCMLVVIGSILMLRQRRMLMRRLAAVQPYRSPLPHSTTGGPDGQVASAGSTAPASARAVKVTRALQAADLPMTSRRWLFVRIITMIVMAAVLWGITRSLLVGPPVGAALGWVITGVWLSGRARSKRQEFSRQLPDLLRILASGIRAGLSFPMALQSAAGGEAGEMRRQLQRVLAEVQVGVPVEVALQHCAERMDNQDLAWAVVALGVQQETGGNLSTILDGVASTVQGRAELSREVQALSAEGRLSAYVLGALPIGVFLLIYAFRREYLTELTGQPLGLLLLGLAALAMVLGGFWMRAIVRVQA